MAKKKPQTRKRAVCLVPDCKARPVLRGVCRRCYHAAYRMRERGEATFEELETKGLLAPVRRHQSSMAKAASE